MYSCMSLCYSHYFVISESNTSADSKKVYTCEKAPSSGNGGNCDARGRQPHVANMFHLHVVDTKFFPAPAGLFCVYSERVARSRSKMGLFLGAEGAFMKLWKHMRTPRRPFIRLYGILKVFILIK